MVRALDGCRKIRSGRRWTARREQGYTYDTASSMTTPANNWAIIHGRSVAAGVQEIYFQQDSASGQIGTTPKKSLRTHFWDRSTGGIIGTSTTSTSTGTLRAIRINGSVIAFD